MKLDKVKLLSLIEEGYIMVNQHPEYPLQILNYTRKTQFERAWNEYTLMARGLVIDSFYDVVARPFPKFFNYEEIVSTPQYPNVPFEQYEIYDKMDGSLGILFYYDGNWHIATRGSFNSEQAIRARAILRQHSLFKLNPENTYLFEIIYPENRIVVNYNGAEKLVLLGVMHRDGYDYSYDEMIRMMTVECPTFEIVKRYDPISDINVLKARNILNEEGYVMRYKDFRMKCKFDDYCRLHSIVTNISTRDIWICLRDGKDINEILDNTPDEFDNWVRDQVKSLNEAFYVQEWNAKEIFNQISYLKVKKDFALEALKYPCSAILFKMFEGKAYDHIIWRIIEPEWSKPFVKTDEE
jgi:hypothetical protein